MFESNKHFEKISDYVVPCATIAGVKSISDVTQESLVSEAVLTVVRHVMWLQQGIRSYRIMHTNNEG